MLISLFFVFMSGMLFSITAADWKEAEHQWTKKFTINAIAGLLCVLAGVFACEATNAQPVKHNNAVYLTIQPGDLGIGPRYDHTFSDFGIYTNATYGNYQLPAGGYIKDHYKVAIGGIYKDWTLGISYHSLGEIKETVELTKRTLYEFSFELGTRISINRFITSIRWDVMRGEGLLDFGFTF